MRVKIASVRQVVAAIRAAEKALERATDLAVTCRDVAPSARSWKSMLHAGDLLNRARLDLEYPKKEGQ